MNLQEEIDAVLNTLYHPELKYIDLSLDRINRLIDAIGGIEHKLPPIVHVAGTNGKGSLIAYLKSIFEAAGYAVHRNTSPHLVRFNERIVLAGKEIDDELLLYRLKQVQALARDYPVTFFEATTVAAFLSFAETPADVLLLEVGLGGRLDATNVIKSPAVTAITPISFDHCRILGDTLEKIAGEKAGIIKPRTPCVVGRQADEALKAIEAVALKQLVPLYRHGREWKWYKENGMAVYESPRRMFAFEPGLAGEHQCDNAATAIAVIERLPQFSISDAQIQQGIADVRWPGRLQRLQRGIYARTLPPGIDLWLDGGHNPQGGEILARWLQGKDMDVYLVCGMVKEKDTKGFLSFLVPHVKALYGIAIPNEPQSQSAEEITAAAKAVGMEAQVADSPENALQTIAQHAKNPAIVCICGSLYLAGYVLGANPEDMERD